MARWEPGARERLQKAALELYATQGFEETTVAEIADAVGLTERTFFRYFTDKREVIFAGEELFQQMFVSGMAAGPKDAAPLEIVASAVMAATTSFPMSAAPTRASARASSPPTRGCRSASC